MTASRNARIRFTEMVMVSLVVSCIVKSVILPADGTGLERMALDILALGEDTRVVMEATGRYYEPVAAALHEYGIRVTVMNPLFIKQSGGGSIRKVKTDKADARKIANTLLTTG